VNDKRHFHTKKAISVQKNAKPQFKLKIHNSKFSFPSATSLPPRLAPMSCCCKPAIGAEAGALSAVKQLEEIRLPRRSLWRSRVEIRAIRGCFFMQNEPNLCDFRAKNADSEQKQSQNEPNQTQ